MGVDYLSNGGNGYMYVVGLYITNRCGPGFKTDSVHGLDERFQSMGCGIV